MLVTFMINVINDINNWEIMTTSPMHVSGGSKKTALRSLCPEQAGGSKLVWSTARPARGLGANLRHLLLLVYSSLMGSPEGRLTFHHFLF